MAKANALLTLLKKHSACKEGLAWAKAYKTPGAAWNACANPDYMLWALRETGKLDDRRARLFACWCVRQVWHLLTDERSRKAVEVSEAFAEGKATQEELAAAWAAAGAAAGDAARAAARASAWAAAWDAARAAAGDAQCAKICELWGNPWGKKRSSPQPKE